MVTKTSSHLSFDTHSVSLQGSRQRDGSETKILKTKRGFSRTPRPGWPKRLELVRATPCVEVHVISHSRLDCAHSSECSWITTKFKRDLRLEFKCSYFEHLGILHISSDCLCQKFFDFLSFFVCFNPLVWT